MKKMMILAMMMVAVTSAKAMSYDEASREALFLSDKMAYELDLTDDQYDAVYEINLDYLMNLSSPRDAGGRWWNRRNADLRYVLTDWQYNRFRDLEYFYRPARWNRNSWALDVYRHYTNHRHFYRNRPSVYINYRGGNCRRPSGYYGERRMRRPTACCDAPTWRYNDRHYGNRGNRRGHRAYRDRY
ncbi:MAG: hypothetical protein K5683_07110 [Prevotella sp.]|nr:hypothetical protein [Prevotella sp.]